MRAFAERSAAAIRSRAVQTIVVGNEAGDMDSVIGSMYLAYLLDAVGQRGGATPYRLPVCPMICFFHGDLGLRPDIVRTLQQEIGVGPQDLVSCVRRPADDPEAAEDVAECFASIVADIPGVDILLFDHNKPHPALGDAPRVVGVVDHHADEGLVDATRLRAEGRLHVVQPAGSACSHLVGLFQRFAVEVPSPRLLLAPIVLDTMNFDPALKKTTPVDEQARDLLLGQVAAATSPESDGLKTDSSLKRMFDELVALKFDVRGLTAQQTLRRDYKKFPFHFADGRPCAVGISSVLLLRHDVEELYGSRAAWIGGIQSFAQRDKCDAMLVMYCAEDKSGGHAPGAMIRQLAVLGSVEFAAAVHAFAEHHSSIGLRVLQTEDLHPDLVFADYDQRDYATSRKALTPLLGAFLQSGYSKM